MNCLFQLRDSYWHSIAKTDLYWNLTQSYAFKSFTIFNLLTSAKFGVVMNELADFVTNSNLNHEILECKLNIALLIWRMKALLSINDLDASLEEIELVEYLQKNDKLNCIDCLLPSLDTLYHIIDHTNMFHPFGLINAYEILSIILQYSISNQRYVNVRIHSIEHLINLMESTTTNNEIDMVCTAVWKYLNAQLSHKQFNINAMRKVDIMKIIEQCRIMCESKRSSKARQTATETISVILINCVDEIRNDLILLTNVCGLLLGLVRDDDVVIRNHSSDIIMHLVSDKDHINSQFKMGR